MSASRPQAHIGLRQTICDRKGSYFFDTNTISPEKFVTLR